MTFALIEGSVQKCITNKKIYHIETKHQRFLELVFATGQLIMRETQQSEKMLNVIKTSEITWAEDL